jgi:hypothetical protein
MEYRFDQARGNVRDRIRVLERSGASIADHFSCSTLSQTDLILASVRKLADKIQQVGTGLELVRPANLKMTA